MIIAHTEANWFGQLMAAIVTTPAYSPQIMRRIDQIISALHA